MTEDLTSVADVLSVSHVSKCHSAMMALLGVSLHLGDGEILGLIRDNGPVGGPF